MYSQSSFNTIHNYIYFLNLKFISIFFNFVIEQHFNDHYLEKLNSNTWFVNGKKIVVNKLYIYIYISYFKPSFDLGVYIIQFFFQYIIILHITSSLDV
jgi:hypothetical protein